MHSHKEKMLIQHQMWMKTVKMWNITKIFGAPK